MKDKEAIKEMEMRKVRDEVFRLKESPLYKYRTENNYYPVLGEGSYDADIVFVGEAPGKNEALSGRPFCGSAGKVLNELLASIELPRENVYITNIVKDRPPENRDPTPEEIELYAPFLDRQLNIIQPKIIATLGRYSMGYVMERFGLSSKIEPMSVAHGKQYQTEIEYGPVYVVPQYHPAASIYNRELKKDLLEDFESLREISRR